MNLLTTFRGSMMEGFLPSGWDLEKIDRLGDLPRHGNVAADRHGRGGCVELGHRPGEFRLVDVEQSDAPVVGEEALGRRQADPARGSGDEGGLDRILGHGAAPLSRD